MGERPKVKWTNQAIVENRLLHRENKVRACTCTCTCACTYKAACMCVQVHVHEQSYVCCTTKNRKGRTTHSCSGLENINFVHVFLHMYSVCDKL